jgi:hypothetical protein
MPAGTTRPAARLAATVLLVVVVVGGCAGQADEPTAASQPSTTTTTSTVAPTTTTVPPLTAKELAWLKAIPKVHKRIDRTLEMTSNLTISAMRMLANMLRSCGRELVRGGSPSDRLQPAYVLVKRGCEEYDKGAVCFTTAARIGIPFAGSAEVRKQTKAIQCGFDARAKGGVPLLDAQDKGAEINAEAG